MSNTQLPSTIANSSEGTLAEIDRRIASGTPSEAAQWVQIRGAVIQQDEYKETQKHERRLDLRALNFKGGIALGALTAGVGLVVAGITYPGLFCLGAALYTVAPDYVMQVLNRYSGQGHQ